MIHIAAMHVLAAFLLTSATPAPRRASAQASAADKAAAEMLFDRGLGLMREKKYPQACLELERSQAIEAGIGTMLYLADCYERVGRTASAWAMFREAASTARAEGQIDRAELGEKRAQHLEPSLSYLTIEAASPPSGFEIFRNGAPVSTRTLGVRVPVDPGEQRLEARAEGYAPWSGAVTVATHGASARIQIPVLHASPPDTARPNPLTLAGGNSHAPAARTLDYPRRPAGRSQPAWRTPLTWALLSVGTVGIGAGALFGIIAIRKNDAAEARCIDLSCENATALAFHNDARAAARLSTGLWLGGAAFLLGGAVLYLTGGVDDEGPQLTLRATPGETALKLAGTL